MEKRRNTECTKGEEEAERCGKTRTKKAIKRSEHNKGGN